MLCAHAQGIGGTTLRILAKCASWPKDTAPENNKKKLFSFQFQNKLFVYIKIPEVPINVSYKGEKEKNKILDVANFLLQVNTYTPWVYQISLSNYFSMKMYLYL
jgi:hypothetical protein